MKATDFNLQKDMKFDPSKGLTTFQDSRLVIFDANAIGLLRQNLIDGLGAEKAREFFLQFGFEHGFSDFLQIKTAYGSQFDSEIDLFASGPVIHTWEGLVHAAPTAIQFDREKGDFFCSGIWTNSYEADQHLSFNYAGSEPVCWTLMGYASGWSTAFFNKPVLAIEPVCMGKGDDHCEWVLKNVEAWGSEAEPYIKCLNKFYNKMKEN